MENQDKNEVISGNSHKNNNDGGLIVEKNDNEKETENDLEKRSVDAKEGQLASAASSTTSARGNSRSVNRRFQVLESQGFIVGKILGQGSYACVRSAYDVKRKHKVAVKIISKRKAPEDFLNKFLPREIDVIKVLKHDFLIAFYQVIETTTRYFLIMELGHTDLLDAIRERKTVDEDKAGMWFYQLHGGILYMHGKGIVHRDLKCENILLDSNDNLKVTDFGFARKVIKNRLGDIKLSETYCGSYAYAAPEILKGTPYDPFTPDVWSIGVILFTMLYGRLPFDDSNHKKLLKQVQSRVVFPAKPDVSEECRILILKMFNKASERIPLPNIRFDPWYKKFLPSNIDVSQEEEVMPSMETSEITPDVS